MTNIVSFLKKVDERSLVLFDELGAGTDPTEGAALAISILSHLHQRGIRTMATTHYSELKVYALSTPGVENACCEFDVESLRPTYRLLIGIPGKSNAFAISGKLGLPDYIIEDAKKRLSEQDVSFEDLLTDLETSKRTIEKEQEEIQVILARLSADAAEYVSEIRTDYATLTELDFIFARVICRANADYYTVAIGLWQMLEKEYVDVWYTRFAAGAVLISIPIAALFMIMQKCYNESMSGAVKG